MRGPLPVIAIAALALSGCGSSDSSTEALPKGPAPKTESAPPGTPGPQERTLGNASGGTGGSEVDK